MPEPVLLKLDVQGFQAHILHDGERMLSRSLAVVLAACVEPLCGSQAEFLDVSLELRDSDFRYAGKLDLSFGDDGRVLPFDAQLVA